MASFRTKLEPENMDLIMHLVRKYDTNPSEMFNKVLKNPQLIIDARSELDEQYKRGKRS